MFCFVWFGLIFRELFFSWRNTGSKTKSVISTDLSPAGLMAGHLRGKSDSNISLCFSPSEHLCLFWRTRNNLECQEYRSVLLYVTVPFFVFSWETRARVTVLRGHPSMLSLRPIQGDRVQLMLDVHWVVSANERDSDEIFHSGVLGKNGSSAI